MAFPLTHKGKLKFPLSGDPDITIERFYEEASYKISGSIAIDADVEVAASDGKLVVSYTVKFKKILIIVSAFVVVLFGVHFSTWDIFLPPGLPRTWGQPGVTIPLTVIYILSVMGAYWLWWFGMIYLIIVARFRSLLRTAWRDLRLP